MYGGFHDKDKLILLSEKMQVCISQIKCNDCAVGVMHLLWWLAIAAKTPKNSPEGKKGLVKGEFVPIIKHNLACPRETPPPEERSFVPAAGKQRGEIFCQNGRALWDFPGTCY